MKMTTVTLDNQSAEYLAAHDKISEFEIEKCNLIYLVTKRLDEDEDITDILIRLKVVKKQMALARDAWHAVMSKEAKENKS